jgi:ankyrin repeat protein
MIPNTNARFLSLATNFRQSLSISAICFLVLIITTSVFSEVSVELLEAVKKNDLSEVEKQITSGVSPNATGTNLYPVLIEASLRGYSNMVSNLVRLGADINAGTPNKNTALIFAVRNKQSANALFLLALGADPKFKNNFGDTAVSLAKKNNLDLVLEWIDNQALEKDPVYALLRLNPEDLKTTLSQWDKKQFNTQDANEIFPLTKVCLKNRWDIAELMLEKGASVNAVNSAGESILHQLARCTNQTIFNNLISKGAKIEALNNNEESPLFLACAYTNEVAVEVLIKAGAELNTVNRKSLLSPLMVACYRAGVPVAKLLIGAGAELNITPKKK